MKNDVNVMSIASVMTHKLIGKIQRRLAWPLRKDDTQKSRTIQLNLFSASAVQRIPRAAGARRRRVSRTDRISSGRGMWMYGGVTLLAVIL